MIELRAATRREARKLISEIEAENLNEGDHAKVRFPNGDFHIYIFRKDWELSEEYRRL